jgi:two-component system sensor histidine kinase KdpD
LLFTAAVIAVESGIAVLVRPYLSPVNLAMIYLLGLVGVSARSSRVGAVAAALVSVAAFDLLCVPPYWTFAVSDTEYIVTFAAMLAVAWVISMRTEGARRQAREAATREAQAQALYRMSARLANETRVWNTANAAAAVAGDVLPAQVVIFPALDGAISFRRRTSDLLPMPSSEETIARWVFRHGKKAGLGIDPLLKATALYVPLQGAREMVGVMALVPTGAQFDDAGNRILIDLLANQIAIAIERTVSQNVAEASRLSMEREQMRSSLLSAASHDLRTPLASILGAASTLRQQNDKLSKGTREDLLDTISEEAERLGRLVGNLLEMTRFESGGVELRREACPLEEIIGTALHRLDRQLQGREVVTKLPPAMPLIYGDEVLLGQVFVNLLENAVKYAPTGGSIDIGATILGDRVQVEVRDHGPGLGVEDTERLFEKFQRGRAQAASGAGLGLAIAKAVVEAHGGSIEAFNHPEGGAAFRFSLPTRALPVEPAA